MESHARKEKKKKGSTQPYTYHPTPQSPTSDGKEGRTPVCTTPARSPSRIRLASELSFPLVRRWIRLVLRCRAPLFQIGGDESCTMSRDTDDGELPTSTWSDRQSSRG